MLLILAGCDCGSEPTRVDGPHPYVRCQAFEVDEGPLESMGGGIEGHTLSLANVESLELFAVRASSVEWLGQNPSDSLQVVLGGFARDEGSAAVLLTALAARGPALLVLGGEDDVEIFQDALDEVDAPNLVSLLGIRRVDFGSTGALVVHGAPGGRYSRGDNACGFVAEDLGFLDEDAEAGDLLLSWAAAADDAEEGLLGQPIGDGGLSDAVADLALLGGIHAWPREQAGFRSSEGNRFVLSVAGGLHVTRDGARFLGQPLTIRIDEGTWSFPESP